MDATDLTVMLDATILPSIGELLYALNNFLSLGLVKIGLCITNDLISILITIICCIVKYVLEALSGLGNSLLNFLGISALAPAMSFLSSVASDLISTLKTIIGLDKLCKW